MDYNTNLSIPKLSYNSGTMKIGTSVGNLGFGGLIAEFKIYKRSLTLYEIKCLYDKCDKVRCK